MTNRITLSEYYELRDYLTKKGFSMEQAIEYLQFYYPELKEGTE